MTTTMHPALLAEQKTTELILSYYSQLQTLNDCIAARPERPYPTREENGIIRQITSTLRLLKGKSQIIIAMEFIMRFADKVRKVAPVFTAAYLPRLCAALLPGIEVPQNIQEVVPTQSPAKRSTKNSQPTAEEALPPTDEIAALLREFEQLTAAHMSATATTAVAGAAPQTETKKVKETVQEVATVAIQNAATPQPVTAKAPADGYPSEEKKEVDGRTVTYWKGIPLTRQHTGGQTENGRSLEERMYYARLRNDEDQMHRYARHFIFMPFEELYGNAYRRRTATKGVELAMPAFNFMPGGPQYVPEMPPALHNIGHDGLPSGKALTNPDGSEDGFWRGRPLRFAYPNGQTESGRSLAERFYCARYRRNSVEMERLINLMLSMPIIELYGRTPEIQRRVA